uniref:Biogenesis of lysosome-related organelles complex 1 subunit 3 n=1 Tax=Anopheles epiroticus TaxID=199890 RepID=A0A182P962_9DIPT
MECQSPNIVAGEASETDDDEAEVTTTNSMPFAESESALQIQNKTKPFQTVRSFVASQVISIEKGIPHLSLSGTAPSSYTFAREAVESSAFSNTPPPLLVASSDEELQRLHMRQAMNERCISMLNEFIHNTVVSVSKQLNETDNFLMKSQVGFDV